MDGGREWQGSMIWHDMGLGETEGGGETEEGEGWGGGAHMSVVDSDRTESVACAVGVGPFTDATLAVAAKADISIFFKLYMIFYYGELK